MFTDVDAFDLSEDETERDGATEKGDEWAEPEIHVRLGSFVRIGTGDQDGLGLLRKEQCSLLHLRCHE